MYVKVYMVVQNVSLGSHFGINLKYFQVKWLKNMQSHASET